MQRRFRSRYGRTAVVRAALLVFLLSGAIVVAVVFALDRTARQSNVRQADTELASVARVAASTVSTMRANLRTRVGELAGSARLQRALLARNRSQLAAIARAHHARIVTRRRRIGTLAAGPRIAASATVANQGRVIALVTIAVPLDDSLLSVLSGTTPMPAHAALLLVRDGHVVAGGPTGANARVDKGEVKLGSVTFAARSTHVSSPKVSVVAVKPMSAIDAQTDPFRRRLFLVAALTLALAAGLAARLGRPVARVLADLARLSRQAQTDALTGIANRRALDERLDDEVDHARRLGTNVAFVIADIDNFKSINDRYGHQTGDEVLRAVSRAFAEAVRELDLAGRFGGEELAAVLPGTQLAGARRLAERVRTAIGELDVRSPDGERIEVTASFGAAAFPTYDTVEALVAAADGALYDAKRNGKNRVETATAKKKASSPAVPTFASPA
jgi:diguanylate cyclase (GGDEF)-like protein